MDTYVVKGKTIVEIPDELGERAPVTLGPGPVTPKNEAEERACAHLVGIGLATRNPTKKAKE